MSKATFKITDTVRDVLARSTITATTVKLPEQLDRKIYTDVMKVIAGVGGKWNRGQGLHVFMTDPRGKLGIAVTNGTAVNEQKQFQAFYTPGDISETACALADIQSGDTVLEPSAGRGALALAARNHGADVMCVEINPESARELRRLDFLTVGADFLQHDPTTEAKFDVVLMNPPFTGGQDIKHVKHALKFLKPGGRLVAIMSPRYQFATTKECCEFREILNGASVTELPAGAFSQSGTNIRTVMVRLNT